MVSGGLGSDETAEIVAAKHGAENLTYLFCDTLVEDDDLYRFLVESTAKRVGVDPAGLLPWVANLPSVSQPVARLHRLRQAREAICEAIPQLVWLIDGRTVWQVSYDRKYVGDSQRCHGAIHLKVIQRNLWLEEHAALTDTICYVGIYHWERERFDGHWGTNDLTSEPEWKQGIREKALPYLFESPLCDMPTVRSVEIRQRLARQGTAVPRLYLKGYKTNNCGGACRKAGIGQWTHLYATDRERFLLEAEEERRFREWIGKDVTILKRTVKGKAQPMTLYELEERIKAGADWNQAELLGNDLGCGGSCAFDTDDQQAA